MNKENLLAKHNEETREKLGNFLKLEKKKNYSETHRKVLSEANHQVNTLLQTRKEIERDLQSYHSQITKQNSHKHTLQIEVDVLQSEMSKLEPTLHDLNSEKNQLEHKNVLLQSENQMKEEEKRKEIMELTSGLEKYKLLGLEFNSLGGNSNLQFSFTQIDPNDPNRLFSFHLKVDPDTDVFLVDQCQPPVQDLDALLGELNRTNDLSLFVRTIRRRFKKLCS